MIYKPIYALHKKVRILTLGMRQIPDVQQEQPRMPIPIDRVCVKNLYRRICLKSSQSGRVCLDSKITACIDLPANQRGIHVSRSAESVVESFADIEYRDFAKVENALENLVNVLLNRHGYALRAMAKLETVYLLDYRDEYVGVEDLIPIKILITVKKSRGGEAEFKIGVGLEGMTVCPCAQQVFSHMENIQSVYVPSHSQRAKMLIVVTSNRNTVDIRDVAVAGLKAFSAPLFTILKRVNEYRLVKKAFESPKFVEDVVRQAIYNIYSIIKDKVDDNTRITVKVESFESIHPYNLCAEASYTVNELKKLLEPNS